MSDVAQSSPDSGLRARNLRLLRPTPEGRERAILDGVTAVRPSLAAWLANADAPVRLDAVRLLLRDVFRAAGGTHDDWDEYDRAMADDGRLAVFVAPGRILGVAP